MSEQIRNTMPIETLRLEPCFVRLTERQKAMIETYVSSEGDKTLAVLTAYNVKDRETARKMSYESFSRPAVIEVLNAYWGLTPFEAFKRDVERAVRNKRLTIAQIRALELLAQMSGWGSANLPDLHGHDARSIEAESTAKNPDAESVATPVRFKVGELVTECDEAGLVHTGRVVSVDANGQPLDIEEVLS